MICQILCILTLYFNIYDRAKILGNFFVVGNELNSLSKKKKNQMNKLLCCGETHFLCVT